MLKKSNGGGDVKTKAGRRASGILFQGEVFHGQGVLPAVGERLLELSVLFLGDIIGYTYPDGLGHVEFLLLGILLDGYLLVLLVF